MSNRILLQSATALAVVFGGTAASQAADAQKVADAVKAQFEGQAALQMTVGSAAAEGEDVVLSDVTIGPKDVEPLKVASIRLEKVTDTEGGGFNIGRIAAPEFTTTEEGMTVSFGGASLENLSIAAPGETDPVKKLLLTTGGTIGKVSVSGKDGEIFKMDGATYTMSPYKPGETMNFSMSVDGMAVDFAKVPDEKARKTMADLGYETMTGKITYAGTWNTTDGRMAIDDMSYIVDDAAALKMKFDISGYTPAFVASIQEMNKQMAAAGNNEQASQAQGLAMLGLMQQLTFNGATIRVEDASLTGKLLDYTAKQQGTDRATIVNQSKGALPFLLAQLQNPEFAQKVTEAVSSYLDNPKSLTITAAPAAAVPFAQIMAAGMSAPQTIPQVLGVTVTAND